MKICNHPFVIIDEWENLVKTAEHTNNEKLLQWFTPVIQSIKAEERENSNGQETVKFQSIKHSNKLRVLIYLIQSLVYTNRESMLIFSQSIKTLNMIEGVCLRYSQGKNPITVLRIDGSYGPQKREEKIRQFMESGEPGIFVLSTRACCEAINLTKATRVVLFDVCWNPCHDEQAICRAHRIGQKKKVFIYRLVAEGTMEERVFARQVGKKSMSNRVVSNEKQLTKIKKNVMNKLFLYNDDDTKPPTLEEIKKAIGNNDIWLAKLACNFIDAFAKPPEPINTWFIADQTKKMSQLEKDQAMKEFEDDAHVQDGIRPGMGPRYLAGANLDNSITRNISYSGTINGNLSTSTSFNLDVSVMKNQRPRPIGLSRPTQPLHPNLANGYNGYPNFISSNLTNPRFFSPQINHPGPAQHHLISPGALGIQNRNPRFPNYNMSNSLPQTSNLVTSPLTNNSIPYHNNNLQILRNWQNQVPVNSNQQFQSSRKSNSNGNINKNTSSHRTSVAPVIEEKNSEIMMILSSDDEQENDSTSGQVDEVKEIIDEIYSNTFDDQQNNNNNNSLEQSNSNSNQIKISELEKRFQRPGNSNSLNSGLGRKTGGKSNEVVICLDSD